MNKYKTSKPGGAGALLMYRENCFISRRKTSLALYFRKGFYVT